MKKLWVLLIIIFSGYIYAQIPNRMSYQAVIRDNNGNLLKNKGINVRVSIINPNIIDSVRYQELHSITTNANGLITLIIGNGVRMSVDSIESIDWAIGNYYIKTETDPTGGVTSYSVVTRNKFYSVPYALYAANGGSGSGSQGPPGENGKSILNGTNDPDIFTGVLGDFYLNTTTYVLFGPKGATGWNSGVSLIGPQGPQGIQGVQGLQGIPGNNANLPSGSNQGDMLYWNGNQWISIPAGTQGQTLTFCNGIPHWGPCTNIATVITYTPTSVSTNSALVGGEVTYDGGYTIISRGICYNTSSDPTITNSVLTFGSGSGAFLGTLSGLNSNTTYYIRAYATNNYGTAYGNQQIITTLNVSGIPTVTTTSISNITSSSANSGGNVTNDGGNAVTSRGVCWNTSQNPTINDSKTSDGNGTGIFNSNITGLNQNTTYYVRAYATNSSGTSYGVQQNFTTLSSQSLPVLSTITVSNITQNSATSGGIITSDGGSSITARGVCWNTSQNPNINNSKTSDGSGIGTYNSSITGLNPGTSYYLRAYATNNSGTAYGNEQIFTTSSIQLPILTTNSVTNITANSAVGGGNILNEGSSSITVRGICWSTSPNPTISDNKTTDGLGTGTFNSSLTGLTPGTNYYVRAYATNSSGTAYGNELVFATISVNLPVLTTTNISNITTISAISGGNISNNGGDIILSRGICWSINSNPTISDTHTSDGTGSGTFISILNSLQPGTNYYVRAYATNSLGTAYGNQVNFTTNSISTATISTANITGITTNSAVGGGSVTNDGGSPITSRGVCWSNNNQNPDLNDSKTSDGNGVGNFNSILSGLTAGTLYYVRAYALNAAGTAYGTTVNFITSAATTAILTTTIVTNITSNSAMSGGNITNDGGAAITSRGICWSASPNPTLLNNSLSIGNGTGIFSGNIIGLTPNTTYYVRAYAINTAGTAFGNELTFTTLQNGSNQGYITDIDGNIYDTINFGTQTWLKQNLKVTKFSNGDAIPLISDTTQWSNLTSAAYSISENNVTYSITYGKLYNFYVVSDTRNVCPSGWHVPTSLEWNTLETYLGGAALAGGKMKDNSLTYWLSPNTGASNSSQFTALPGGKRGSDGTYTSPGSNAYWWTSTSNYYRRIDNNSAEIFTSTHNVKNGLSIRCVKNTSK